MNRARFLWSVAALLLGVHDAGAQKTGGTSTATNTVAFYTNTPVTTYATATVQTYATLLEARMPGGPVLFSQWLATSYLDASFAAAVLQAEAALRAAGASGFTGPTLLSSQNRIVDVSTSTVRTGYQDMNDPNFPASQLLVGTIERVGVSQYDYGYFGVCSSYTLSTDPAATADFVLPTGCTGAQLTTQTIAAGDVVLETRVAFFLHPLETETTTTTMELRQAYEIVGIPVSTTVPEPSTWALMLAGLGVLGLRARRTPRD